MHYLVTQISSDKSDSSPGVPMGAEGTLAPIMPAISDEAALEAVAREIEQLESLTILRIAARVRRIHDFFKYRRNEGGFAGYMERRLGCSSSASYRYLDVHERFGTGECLPNWETLPRSALYLLAAPATPDEAVKETAAQIEAGKKPSVAEVKKTIAKAKKAATITSADMTKPEAGADPISPPAPMTDAEALAARRADTAPVPSDDLTIPGFLQRASKPATDADNDGDRARNDHADTAAPVGIIDTGASQPTAEPAGAARLLEYWQIATADERRAVLRSEGVGGLVELLKGDQELLGDLHDRIVGQSIATASKKTSFARNSTTRLHCMLRCAEQREPSDEDIRNMIAAARAIVRDAEKREIARSNVVIAEGEAKKRKPKGSKK
jgi:hypothetical protein